MCGVIGIYDITSSTNTEQFHHWLKPMLASLTHRGPDDQGVWINAQTGIALAHTRLSIIDLSAHGHQPMQSQCQSYVISYNGEIYNFPSLRQELEQCGITFIGQSDTEVLLAAISQWGIEHALTKLNGMFAMIIWDKQNKTLHLVRDRLGIKPLYYYQHHNLIIVASELKAIIQHPMFNKTIEPQAIHQYLRFKAIPAPLTIYKNTFKLKPATLISFNQQHKHETTFWSLTTIAEQQQQHLIDDEIELKQQFHQKLTQSIQRRLISDVPLGAFLSGGIDSSLIVSMMAQQHQTVKTFTIGFQEDQYNEAHYAKKIADHFSTDHHELYVTEQDALDLLPHLSHIYDEPFADASNLPTLLVSKLAKSQVTVCLSGDGGDELFAGYTRIYRIISLWKKLQYLPVSIRHVLSQILLRYPDACSLIANLFLHNANHKLIKLANLLNSKTIDQAYQILISHWQNQQPILQQPIINNDLIINAPHINDHRQRLLYYDMTNYLPNDILTKVDKASMAVSLEARVPLLDHELVEFAWQVPWHYKYRQNTAKWLLHETLNQHCPKQLFNRPKMGFSVPIARWLRTSLQPWANELLDDTFLQQQGIFNHQLIHQKWQQHQSGRYDWQDQLWSILMFQAWYRRIHCNAD